MRSARTRTAVAFALLMLLGLAPDARAAGDVTAIVKGGTLVLVGDGLANDVRIEGTISAGAFHVMPESATTLNGGGSFVFIGITRGIDATTVRSKSKPPTATTT